MGAIERTFVLTGPAQAQQAWEFVKANARPMADAGKPLAIKVTEHKHKRSLEQNAKFHAICGDIARQHQYMNRTLSLQQWKVLLVSGHAIATGLGADVVPGLEGEFVNIRESTANMSIQRKSSLIEYALAYCATNNIKLSEKSSFGA